MGILGRIVGWMASEIQKTTGEADRREKVSQLKELALLFKEKVSAAIDCLNKSIQAFNTTIQNLNNIRSTLVKGNIQVLSSFLNKFGLCKEMGEYTPEKDKVAEQFPEHDFYKIEDYIGTVDWSQDDVFLNTFLLSPIGMKMKTRNQNLSMQEHINELIIQTDATVKELEAKQFCTELEKNIAEQYISNVLFISRTISTRIVPELELVEAFFQAEHLKNELICGHELKDLKFPYRVQSIANTPFDRHYQFVKNAVAFYIIACKIYNTPVLTKLLTNCSTSEDLETLEKERLVLDSQSDALTNTMVVMRG